MKIIGYCLIFILALLLSVYGQNFQACLDNCSPLLAGGGYRTDCCGCCNSTEDYTCHQIPEFATCCNGSQAFCGCTSFRAACTAIAIQGVNNGTNQFGTCYNPTEYSCSFNLNTNSWTLCPESASACFSTSGTSAVCCDQDSTCQTNSTTGNPFCVPNPNTPTNQTVQCGDRLCSAEDSCCLDIEYGPLCYSNTTQQCIGGQYLCGINASFCANTGCYDPTVYVCCEDTGLISQKVLGCPSQPLCPCLPPPPLKCGSLACAARDECCGDITLGPVCYDPTHYVCVRGQVLCGCGNANCNMGACGTACYDANMYECCPGNNISQLAIGCVN